MRSKRRPFCNRADTGCNIVRRESELTSARSSMARETEKPRSGGRQMTASVAQARASAEDAGAPPADELTWDQIDWDQINEEVTRLQARIAKATQAGRWNKVQASQRPLGIPPMRDRAMQALWLLALTPVAETTADKNSYGFRPRRSTADAIEHCFNALAKRDSAQWVLEGDIRGCFDNISHDWLLKHVPMDKIVLRKWLHAGSIDQGVLFPTEAGTPQGGIASPVLANMALD